MTYSGSTVDGRSSSTPPPEQPPPGPPSACCATRRGRQDQRLVAGRTHRDPDRDQLPPVGLGDDMSISGEPLHLLAVAEPLVAHRDGGGGADTDHRPDLLAVLERATDTGLRVDRD